MSTRAVVERIRDARQARRALRIQGAGTWLDAGRPVHAAETLSLADDHGVVEYVPGDLTLTARAGTTLAELERVTLQHGQWLPLAPWGSADATLGATIGTATAGPYAAAFGLPRDAALGMEFVTGTGDVVRSGGRVVKNVAGFDLTRLLTGSWGTLGVITEVTVRLRALPQTSRTVSVRVATTPERLARACAAVRALPFAPFACELVNGALASRLGIGDATMLLVRLGGNVRAVAAQLDAIGALGAVEEIDAGVIDRLRGADAGLATWRISSTASRFVDSWTAAQSAAGALTHGNPIRGVVRVAAPAVQQQRSNAGLRLVIERQPREAWSTTPVPAPRLARAVREKFDPDGILNPGILAELA